ncbi:MAG TPA: 3-deoxy-7-phosphoheptulonate synthase, partial [Candidatus Sumerlaeota bacterium]|nr:3-deoxy-7-phosphoheptulonate synthase [Candidatus Sumerlaeota bacterium]
QTPGVEAVIPIMKPYKLVGREIKPDPSVVDVDGIKIGGREVVVIAGPCSVESEEQMIQTATAVKKAGAKILRGGAYKPRTSPYAFQGLEEAGLKILAKAREVTGLKIITEIVCVNDIDPICEYADMIQIGARNCQNYSLLKTVGKTRLPVVLKRGMATTIKEFLMAAEYIMSQGNYNVILCERGIRTFEDSTRFTLDLNAVPVLKGLSHLPLIVDPSHGTGNYRYVTPMGRAAIAAGADGLIVEVHPNPKEAASDGPQSLLPEKFEVFMAEVRKIVLAMDRVI